VNHFFSQVIPQDAYTLNGEPHFKKSESPWEGCIVKRLFVEFSNQFSSQFFKSHDFLEKNEFLLKLSQALKIIFIQHFFIDFVQFEQLAGWLAFRIKIDRNAVSKILPQTYKLKCFHKFLNEQWWKLMTFWMLKIALTILNIYLKNKQSFKSGC